jgi:hypothetical protein
LIAVPVCRECGAKLRYVDEVDRLCTENKDGVAHSSCFRRCLDWSTSLGRIWESEFYFTDAWQVTVDEWLEKGAP